MRMLEKSFHVDAFLHFFHKKKKLGEKDAVNFFFLFFC